MARCLQQCKVHCRKGEMCIIRETRCIPKNALPGCRDWRHSVLSALSEESFKRRAAKNEVCLRRAGDPCRGRRGIRYVSRNRRSHLLAILPGGVAVRRVYRAFPVESFSPDIEEQHRVGCDNSLIGTRANGNLWVRESGEYHRLNAGFPKGMPHVDFESSLQNRIFPFTRIVRETSCRQKPAESGTPVVFDDSTFPWQCHLAALPAPIRPQDGCFGAIVLTRP